MMARWRVWSYDVWGNKHDGWDVNDRASLGYVEGPADPTDAQAIKMVKGLLLSRAASVRNIELDGDEGVIYYTQKKDGYPLGEANRE